MVSPEMLERCLPPEEAEAGRALFEAGRVRLMGQDRDCLRLEVRDGDGLHAVTLRADHGSLCACAAGLENRLCRHLLAAGLFARNARLPEALQQQRGYSLGAALLETAEPPLPPESEVKVEPVLTLTPEADMKPRLSLGLRMGTDRLYVVRNIPQLLEALDTGEEIPFGKGFTFRPAAMALPPAADRLLRLLLAPSARYLDENRTRNTAVVKQLALSDALAGAVLEALAELPFTLVLPWRTLRNVQPKSAQVPLLCQVAGSARSLTVSCRISPELQPLTEDFAWAAAGENLFRVPAVQRRVLKLVWRNQAEGRAVFAYRIQQLDTVIGELLPALRLCGLVDIDAALQRELASLPLQTRLYLDMDGREIVASTRFVYGPREFDPFAPAAAATLPDGRYILRDGVAERQVLDILGQAGFHIRGSRVYLSGTEAVYRFMTAGVAQLQERCEVYLSKEFRQYTPRRPQLAGSLKMRGGWLEFALTEAGKPLPEQLGIIEALSRRRQYYRLKDGSFLDLSDLAEWQDAADALYEAALAEREAQRGAAEDALRMSAFRTAYLETLLAGLPVSRSREVRETAAALAGGGEDRPLPEDALLRPYQRTGLRWLLTLDRLRMGGILADDMGLGKTVQMIAAIHAAREPGVPSLIVCPSSLCFNWLGELNRFAPDLSVLVMNGTAAQRAAQAEHIRKAGDVDVVVTSYPLIRRDAPLLRDLRFRFVVLDEAQQIKNAWSVGAAAVKQLQARTRIALTGTPMENSIGELWSLFDFVLPGFLMTYTAFLRRYQDSRDLDQLREKIRPFLLRRLKKDVLTELPDKLETRCTAQMTPEQENVYRAAMQQLRKDVLETLDRKGYGGSRIEVLAAITQLRQICCHPALVLPDYAGSSGKLELLLDILPSLVGGGHRILLFSQFTTMLRLLEKQLRLAGYRCLYLDGGVPPAERLSLTERFNAGEGQIFLISLKAGGTGLNLTGADTVIHYDPWWNPAAEDQAADRAYRIGQTRQVEVIRLVTHDSIEQQVVAMGEGKKALFDQLITPGEELITALSEKDVRALFA